jgi:alkanesulfonate monooxygenase SsuD/methylene tetrahydromethanopterin reductase-like flavin-dependent oxidoreductase (luciferase family)
MTTSPKHGLYLQNSTQYIGDLATPEHLVEYAVAAEDAGWDGVFCADVLTTDWIDPWITLSGIATRTDRIRLGTWVTPVPRRQPWQLARDLATLDQLSDGRVILGAGLGTEEDYTTFGEPWEPARNAARYDEALDVITGLWRGEPFTHHGDHFTVEDLAMQPTPVQEPRIPIVVGCWWPNKPPLHRGARWDGIMPYAASFIGQEGLHGEPVTGTPEEAVRDIVAYYRDLADEPGEVVVPIDEAEMPPDFAETAAELGATWLLSTHLLDDDGHEQNLERIRAGPGG